MASTESQPENTCQYYVTRKKRNCKLLAIPGKTVCSQHLCIEDTDEKGRRRVLCPLDSTHSCYEDDLQKHMGRCNVSKFVKNKPVYYEENINSGEELPSKNSEAISLKDVSDEKLTEILKKLESAFSENVSSPAYQNLSFPALEEELERLAETSSGSRKSKHLKQNSSIMGILEKNNLLHDDTCFVEFGAGRGQLSHCIVSSTQDLNCNYLLIDRASQRHKFDNKHKADKELKIARLKIDIKHLNIAKAPKIADRRNLVATSKHLCGSATDLALRCIISYINLKKDKNETREGMTGILIAVCCHHRCSWQHYVGKDFLISCGFDEDDFNVIKNISSWATCGIMELSKTEDKNHWRLGLSPSERTEIGIKCKLLLDEGRMRFLQSRNFRTEILFYTDTDISPENVALLAITKDT